MSCRGPRWIARAATVSFMLMSGSAPALAQRRASIESQCRSAPRRARCVKGSSARRVVVEISSLVWLADLVEPEVGLGVRRSSLRQRSRACSARACSHLDRRREDLPLARLEGSRRHALRHRRRVEEGPAELVRLALGLALGLVLELVASGCRHAGAPTGGGTCSVLPWLPAGVPRLAATDSISVRFVRRAAALAAREALEEAGGVELLLLRAGAQPLDREVVAEAAVEQRSPGRGATRPPSRRSPRSRVCVCVCVCVCLHRDTHRGGVCVLERRAEVGLRRASRASSDRHTPSAAAAAPARARGGRGCIATTGSRARSAPASPAGGTGGGAGNLPRARRAQTSGGGRGRWPGSGTTPRPRAA